MGKHALESVELTNMCMIEDKETHTFLVQVREKDWKGISFPGGHVEVGEAIVPSVEREVLEETGLTITNLKPCGIKDWYDKKEKKRYIVFFYKTSTFTGELLPRTEEGENRWMTLEEIKQSEVANDFLEMLSIFTGESSYTEFFYQDNIEDEENRWVEKFY